MSKVLIAGGTGLIGKVISKKLMAKNISVALLSRKENLAGPIPAFRWSFKENFIDPRALEGVEYIINLAGAGIADKLWTQKRKDLIISSRVNGNKLIANYINEGKINLKKYLSASAIGFYGDRGQEVLDETSSSSNGFLSTSTQAWEKAIDEVVATKTPCAIFRIGLVLANEGGVFPKLMMTAKFGLGSYFGSGEQFYSWIHIEDMANMIIWALENENMLGVYNGTAPNPITNKEIIKAILDKKGGFKLIAPVPSFLLKTMMGELSSAVLGGSKVLPKRAIEDGFKFEYEWIDSALDQLMND